MTPADPRTIEAARHLQIVATLQFVDAARKSGQPDPDNVWGRLVLAISAAFPELEARNHEV